MDIDVGKFENWLRSRFDQIREKGSEYCINSIFTPDKARKLWINIDKNVYHCWKTDESGTIPKLISIVDKISYKEAASLVAVDPGDVRKFDEAIERLKRKVEIVRKEKKERRIFYPEGFRDFKTSDNDPWKEDALSYILGRKIEPKAFNIGYCCSGDYEGCIILPVYDPDGSLVYWTARSIVENESRYKNPPEDLFQVGREEILWGGREWPRRGSVVFLTEGIFDAMSLQQVGVPAIALLGRTLSRAQFDMMKERKYSFVLALDNDEQGRESEIDIYELISSWGGETLGGVTPDPQKDWNRMLIEEGPEFLQSFIPQNIHQLNLKSKVENLMSSL